MERCFTTTGATMDSGLLRGALTNEEEDSAREHPAGNNENQE